MKTLYSPLAALLCGLPLLLSGQIKALTVTAATPSLCAPGGNAQINVAATQTGVNYTLRNSANTAVAGPTAGNGSTVAFTFPVNQTGSYNVLAEAAQSSALYFDGTDAYISTDSLDFAYQNTYTFEAWVKTPDPGTGYYEPIFWVGTNGISDIEVYVRPNDLMVLYDRGKPGLQEHRFPSPPDFAWFHLSVVYTGTTTRVYYNGVQQTVISGTPNGSLTRTSEATVTFGLGPNITVTHNHQRYLEGMLDDIRIWSTERSDADIAGFASTCLTGTEPGLEAYYPLNDLSGSGIATDAAGNNDGTLIGTNNASDWWMSENPLAPCVSPASMQLTQTATVTLVEMDTTVTMQVEGSDKLLISSQNHVQHQWIDCQTLAPVSGATGYYFVPTVTGSYAVVLTTSGCSDTSNCHTVTIGGVGTDAEQGSRCSLAPNPTTSKVNVQIEGGFTAAFLQVYSSTGQQLATHLLEQAHQEISLPDIPGLYFLHLTVDGQHQTLRVLRL